MKYLTGFILGYLTYFSLLEYRDYKEYYYYHEAAFGPGITEEDDWKGGRVSYIDQYVENRLLEKHVKFINEALLKRPYLGNRCGMLLDLEESNCPLDFLKLSSENYRYSIECPDGLVENLTIMEVRYRQQAGCKKARRTSK